jgi:drug/metabolite transporter (DMT)-like permease
MVAGVAAFATHDVAAKKLAHDALPLVQLVGLRAAVGLVAVAPLALAQGRAELRPSDPGLHAARVILQGGAIAAFFAALRTIPLATASAVVLAAPALSTLLAVAILHERATHADWAGVVAGCIGVMIIVRPGGFEIDSGFAFALISCAAYAALTVVTRMLGGRNRPVTVVFWTLAGQVLILLPLAAVTWTSVTGSQWVAVVLAGVLTLAGQLGKTAALRFAPVTVVAPLQYSGLLWAALFGFVFFSEVPAASWWVGGALIVVAGVSSPLWRSSRVLPA